MPGEQQVRALRLDLTGLREEHVHHEPVWSRRRAMAALVGLSLVLVVAAVAAVVLDGLWALGQGLLVAALSASGGTAVRRRWPARTVLEPEGLDVRDRGVFRDRYAWSWVAEVRCSPRRRPPGTAVLRDGRRLRLVGMPPEDVERLAAALARARAGGPAVGP